MKTKTEIKGKLLKDITIKDGDTMTATINEYGDKIIKGTIKVYGSNLYFCQDVAQGDRLPSGLFKYKYSWSFKQYKEFGRCTSGVNPLQINDIKVQSVNNILSVYKLTKSSTTKVNLTTHMFAIDKYTTVTLDNGLQTNIKTSVIKPSKVNVLFWLSNHPDCCGLKLLYGFNAHRIGHGYNTKSAYDTLTKEDDKRILELLFDGCKASKTAILSSSQTRQQEFLTRLGFKKLHSYSNPTSRNDVTVFHLDYKDYK